MNDIDISPIAMIGRHSRLHGDADAVVYEDRRLTYRELYESVGLLAAALRADGVGPGDRIAYAGLNSLTFLETYFAATWVGAAFVPLNFRLAPPEAHGIIRDARPDVLIAEPKHAHGLDSHLGDLAVRRLLLVDDDPQVESEGTLSDLWGSLAQFRSGNREIPAHAPMHAEEIAALLYTSGTTGKPKGVILTQGNLWWNSVNVDSVVDTRVGDVYLAVAPLFHIGGFNALMIRTLTRGGTVVIRRTFDPSQALADLVAYRVNGIFLVPAMLAAIQRQPGFEDSDLSELRSTIVAGAPVPPALIEHYARRGVLLQQAWGLTETAPFATYLESAKTDEKLGSCGVPMPYTRVRVVDPATLADVEEPGTTGELWVQGPNVSPGYWNNPEATSAVFTADGWFRTGDIGYRDEDGYLFIVDRLKDMIITGGEDVYPAELENVLVAHPAIIDAAVIGVPDEQWGECVCAVVQFDGVELDLDALRDYLSAHLARYKLPRRLVVRADIPRNGAGKLDKPLIRALVRELDDAASSAEIPIFTENVRIPRKKR